MNYFFSPNLISDLQIILQYDFMRHAYEAGTIVAIVAGLVGYFVVLRKSSFAAHALSHVGFTGAAGAVLLGIDPLLGLFVFTSGSGIFMALLSKKAKNLDIQIGTVLAFMLGLGVLFISLYKGYATEAYSILFGQILGISQTDVTITFFAGIAVILASIFTYKVLLFTSLDEEVAQAKGISITGTNLLFMILVAGAVSISVQVVGVLLIFALMVTPAAIAERISKRPITGIFLSVFIALFCAWLGLFLSFYLSYPVSFFITAIAFVLYMLVRILDNNKS